MGQYYDHITNTYGPTGDASLWGYWRFEEASGDFADSSGVGDPAVKKLISILDPLYQQTGLIPSETGYAIRAESTDNNSRASLSVAARQLLNGRSALTIELTFSFAGTSQGYLIYNNASNSQLFLTINGDRNITFTFHPGVGGASKTITTISSDPVVPLLQNTPYLLTVCADAANDAMYVWVNGTPVRSASSVGFGITSFNWSASAGIVGHLYTGTILDATLDDTVWIAKKLSDAEVFSNYQAWLGLLPATYYPPTDSISLATIAPVQIPATPGVTSHTLTLHNGTAMVVGEADTVSLSTSLYAPVFTPWIKLVSNIISMGLSAVAPQQLPVTPNFAEVVFGFYNPITNPILIGPPDSLSVSMMAPAYAKVEGDVWYYEAVVVAKLESVTPTALALTLHGPVGGIGTYITGAAYACYTTSKGYVQFTEIPVTGSTEALMIEAASTLLAEVAGSSSSSGLIPLTSGTAYFELLITGRTQ